MGRYDGKKLWLLRYQEAKKDLKNIEAQYNELIQSQESAGGIDYSKDSGGGSGRVNDLSNYMVLREKVGDRYRKKKLQNLQIGLEVQEAINKLPTADERILMTLKYMNGLKWEDVCQQMHLSWTQVVYNLHGRALSHLDIPGGDKE